MPNTQTEIEMMTMHRCDNGNWFTPAHWNFFADDGFGNLVRISNWPAMTHSSLQWDCDYGF